MNSIQETKKIANISSIKNHSFRDEKNQAVDICTLVPFVKNDCFSVLGVNLFFKLPTPNSQVALGVISNFYISTPNFLLILGVIKVEHPLYTH